MKKTIIAIPVLTLYNRQVRKNVINLSDKMSEDKMEEKKEEKSLLQTWREIAYNQEQTKRQYNEFWAGYFVEEKRVYKELLSNPDEVVTGTVQELADKYDFQLLVMVGFLDGINDSLKNPNPIETMTADTEVNLGFEPELLYKNMVAARAEWLYNLKEWDDIIPKDRRKELYKEEKMSGTVIKGEKVGRNDPCPCGSGKKYKKCCGR